MSESEIERLRRIAYSREGTIADRERLASLEREPVPTATVADPEHIDTVGPALPGSDPIAPASHPPAHRRPRGVLIAALVGVSFLVGGLAGGGIAAAVTGSSPGAADALAIFDREPRAADDPSMLPIPLEVALVTGDRRLDGGAASPEDADVRWLGSFGSSSVWAILVPVADGSRRVCLVVDDEAGISSTCVAEADFREHGVTSGNAPVVGFGPVENALAVVPDVS